MRILLFFTFIFSGALAFADDFSTIENDVSVGPGSPPSLEVVAIPKSITPRRQILNDLIFELQCYAEDPIVFRSKTVDILKVIKRDPMVMSDQEDGRCGVVSGILYTGYFTREPEVYDALHALLEKVLIINHDAKGKIFDVNRDCGEATALFTAAKLSDYDSAKLLMKYGTNPNLQIVYNNRIGVTAVDAAFFAFGPNTDIYKLLLEKSGLTEQAQAAHRAQIGGDYPNVLAREKLEDRLFDFKVLLQEEI